LQREKSHNYQRYALAATAMIDLMVGLLTCFKGKIISFCLSALVLQRLGKQKSLHPIYNNLFAFHQGLQYATEELILQQNKQSHQFLFLRMEDTSFFRHLYWKMNQLNLKLFQYFNQGQIQVGEFNPRPRQYVFTGYNKYKASFGFRRVNLGWILNRGGLGFFVALRLSQPSKMRVLASKVPSRLSKGDNHSQHMLYNNESSWHNIRRQINSSSAGQVVNVSNVMGNASEMVVSLRKNKLKVACKQELNRNLSQDNTIQKADSDLSPEISLNIRKRYLDALVMLKECLIFFDGSNQSYQKVLRILGQASNVTRGIYDYSHCQAENALQTVFVETGNLACELESQVNNSTALHQEIASRKQVQIELEKSRSLQQATLESTGDGILVIDNCGNITEYNQKFLQMWGIPESAIQLGSNRALKIALSQLKYPKHYIASIRQLHKFPTAQLNDAIALKDGRIFERFSQPQFIGGNIIGRVWSFRDITAHKLAEAKIKHQALHDLLTDLPNRVLFNERLADALEQASASNEQIAVCFLDLDRFKIVNDTLGHAIGDQLLKSVSTRLTQSLREGDIIARWGGDEFTILLPKVRDVKDIVNIQERILAALKPAFDIENHHLHISASIGIALYPAHGEDTETLIKHADVALHGAKSQGRNKYQFYNSAINSQATELFIIENSLYHALEQHEFSVYYQPQVNITTNKITKMEALLRWQHPELGLIPPAKFIPLAEETGLIVPIGEWVLRNACSQVKYWQNKLALPSLSIAVNLSVRQFQQPNLVGLIKQILAETQLAPECLELEITETIAMHNIELTIDILNQLNQMGISISIDDFGTGYCSLSYIKNFPIHTLKIDRSFIRDLTTNTQDVAITTAIIALAQGLNLSVVAEGVETEEQCNLLKILKCELMQGYLFSCPISGEEATQLLRKSKYSLTYDSCLIA
jgi:diguanylate cyclase (GGDEF)-like protein